jgi:hypothetical protein
VATEVETGCRRRVGERALWWPCRRRGEGRTIAVQAGWSAPSTGRKRVGAGCSATGPGSGRRCPQHLAVPWLLLVCCERTKAEEKRDSNDFEMEELTGGEVWAGPTLTPGPRDVAPGHIGGRMVRLNRLAVV